MWGYLNGHCFHRVDDFNEVGVGSEDGSEVREEVRPIFSKVGGKILRGRVLVRSVRVWGPYIEAAFFSVRNEVSIIGGGVYLGAEAKKRLSILDPIRTSKHRHARESSWNGWVTDS